MRVECRRGRSVASKLGDINTDKTECLRCYHYHALSALPPNANAYSYFLCSRGPPSIYSSHRSSRLASFDIWYYNMNKRTRAQQHLAPEGEPQTKKTRTQLPSSVAPPSTPGTAKILSWNVETPIPFLELSVRKAGPSTEKPASHLSLLRDLIARHNFPEFVCLQEVRARQTDKEWIASLKVAPNGNGDEPQYTTFTSLNRATRGQRHFGVITYVRNPEDVAAAREVDWDTEGRVMILEMKSGWALVNVYALNGSEYMWRDAFGRCPPKTRNERKREFNQLLMEECRAMQVRGLRLVLVGDFNISLTKRDCVPRLRTEYPHSLARKEFKDTFIPVLDVVDVYRTLHGDRSAFSWFAKGKPQGADAARVDYALVERPLVDHVVDSIYLEDPQERAHSDHAPFLLLLRDMDNISRPAVQNDTAQPTADASTTSQPHESSVAEPPYPLPDAALDLQSVPTADSSLPQLESSAFNPSMQSETTIDPSLQMDPLAFGLLVEQAVAASAASSSS